jgi:hypothetical protein
MNQNEMGNLDVANAWRIPRLSLGLRVGLIMPAEGALVKSESELVADANENFVACYRKLAAACPAGRIHDAGAVFAFVTGLPMAVFNGCVVIDSSSAAAVSSALTWVSGHGLPCSVWIAEQFVPELGHVPLEHGFVAEEVPYPGMVLHPVPELPRPAEGVVIEPVVEQNRDEYLQVSLEGDLGREVAERLASPSFAGDPEVRLFLGR